MAISITIGLIVMVAALNIVASLILLVMEKHRDIAILKTMGASGAEHHAGVHVPGRDHRAGRAPGSARRRGGRRRPSLDRYQLIRIPIDVYQVSHVPFVILPLDFALVVGLAIAVCLVATHLPVAPGVETGSGGGAAIRIG